MSSQVRRNFVGTFLFVFLWVVLAVARPSTTFHLAPLIVTAWPAVGEREPKRAAAMAVTGLLIAGATILVLSITGMLQGPSLLPWGGSALESVVAATAGAVIGVLPSLFRFERASRG